MPLLKKLHWLSIDSRIEYKIFVLAYKALFGSGSEYLKELLVVEIGHEGLRSTHNTITLLEPRTVLTTSGDRSFVKAAFWNHLPQCLKLANTLCHIKSDLKTAKGLSINVNIFMRVQTIHLLIPPLPPPPKRVHINIF